MLILARKLGEGVVIGEDIYIKVVSIDKGNVKLGFQAPAHTLILRSELKEAVASENQKASQAVSDEVLAGMGQSIQLGKFK
ncbi:carbon storage regulator [Helicobacter bizzozeronii CIII-1]|uniref:Translational regulator CsrA n=1 Tax=Helicobacter bizzozeronii (strain CIII-1) TaxID=1002804 RepID=F8KSV9_HELBC|nr:carbon storage regulator [Helicobacter bizzozeronii]GMT39035.1 Carbon storage regulator CsrA [Helicobacter bizzozeronii]CCB79893.1 carbon storage regulator [Helicobacter bizzozeronii CIII-1]